MSEAKQAETTSLPAPVSVAAILCGGKARRMGTDKAALRLAGRPLLDRVWDRVAPLARAVVAVGGNPQTHHLGVEVVPDRYPGAQSLGGIATALHYAAANSREPCWVLVLACDMPFLQPALLRRLLQLRHRQDAVVPHVEAGYEPLCALYRTTCLPAFERQIGEGNLRIRDIFRQVRAREVSAAECRRFDPRLFSFINLNRPDDVLRARAILQAEGPEAGAGGASPVGVACRCARG